MPVVVPMISAAGRTSRPTGETRMRRSSPQADGLRRWWPVMAANTGIDRTGPGIEIREMCEFAASLGNSAFNETPRIHSAAGYSGCPPFVDGGLYADTNTWGFYTPTTEPYIPFPVTLTCWVAPYQANLTKNLVRHQVDSGNGGYRSYLESSGTVGFVIGGVGVYSTSATYVADVWQLIAVSVTGNGGTATAYRYRSDTGDWSVGAVSIGTMTGTPNRWSFGGVGTDAVGAFADMRVYDRVLTFSEISHQAHPATRWDLYDDIGGSRVYMLPAAAGGGFQPAWAARSTVTIAGGAAA